MVEVEVALDVFHFLPLFSNLLHQSILLVSCLAFLGFHLDLDNFNAFQQESTVALADCLFLLELTSLLVVLFERKVGFLLELFNLLA